METMLTDQHLLRSPLLEAAGNLTLEERALLAARSQLFLRAAAAAVAGGPYGGGGGACGVYPGGSGGGLWGPPWACLAPPPIPRPAPGYLSHHRFSPYALPLQPPPKSPASSHGSESPRSASPPHWGFKGVLATSLFVNSSRNGTSRF
jgi:T-box protein 20